MAKRMFETMIPPALTRSSSLAGVILPMLAYTIPAFGQSPIGPEMPAAPEPPPEAPKEKAQRLLREGFQHLDEGESATALGYFRDAYTAFPRANLLLNIGSTLRQLGKNAESAAVYRSYLLDPDAVPARKEQVERILREIALVIGKITIDVGSSDAHVLVDGQSISGGAVRSVEVDIGPHTVIALVKGKPKAVETVQVFAGRDTALVLHFEKEAPPQLVVVKEKLPPIQVAGIVLSAVGVVSLGFGTGFGIAAFNDAQSIKGYCSPNLAFCSPEAEKLVAGATFKARVSTGAFVVGGATGLLGAVFLVVGRGSKDAAPVRPVATITGQDVYMGVVGTW